MNKNKNLSPFDWFKHLTEFKTPWEKFSQDEQKTFNAYILNRIISMNSRYIEYVNEAQSYQVPSKYLYNFYLKIIPKGKQFSRYIKSSKKVYGDDVINNLSRFFTVSKREIYDNLELLSQENIIYILERMGVDSKKIKTMLNGK